MSSKSAMSGSSKSKSAMSVSDVEIVENTTLTTSDTSTLTSTLTTTLTSTLTSSITSSLTTTLTTTSALLTKVIQNTTSSTLLLESQDTEVVAASGSDDSDGSSMNMGYVLGATSLLAVSSIIVYFLTKKSKDKELTESYDCEEPPKSFDNQMYLVPSDCYYDNINEQKYDLSTHDGLYEQTPMYDLATQ